MASSVPELTSGNQNDCLVGEVVGLDDGSGVVVVVVVVVVVLVVVVVDDEVSKIGGARLGHDMSSQVNAQQHPDFDPNK